MTIGQLAKQFGLSRSTLLYYDSIGLLRPSERNRSNYRRYTPEDCDRLKLICMYRQMGLPMAAIGAILDAPRHEVQNILERRLLSIDKEIKTLREQQLLIIRIIGERSLQERIPFINKESWVALMRSIGLDENSMRKWHEEFEKLSPRMHQEFLEGLGIPAVEIERIRQWSNKKTERKFSRHEK